MPSQPVDTILCPACLASLEPAAAACPYCGTATRTRPPSPAGPSAAAHVPLQNRPWFVLALVFGAALFLGYPLLWQTPAFSRRTKIVLSILVAIETVVVFWLFFLVMRWSYLRVVNSL